MPWILFTNSAIVAFVEAILGYGPFKTLAISC